MAFKSYREESKTNWGTHQIENLNMDQINTGCFLRIADATEAMAKNNVQLQADLNWYKQRYNEVSDANNKLHRRISALQGVITRMKNKKV